MGWGGGGGGGWGEATIDEEQNSFCAAKYKQYNNHFIFSFRHQFKSFAFA